MRIIAFDIGDKKIGVAVSDPLGVAAAPLCIVVREDDEETAQKLSLLAQEKQASKIIIGIPLSLDGGEGESAQKVRVFASLLAKKTDITIEYFDESGSTREAKRVMLETKGKKQRRHMEDDAIAAAVILQRYLDINSNII